jgi:CHAT domain-containing protein
LIKNGIKFGIAVGCLLMVVVSCAPHPKKIDNAGLIPDGSERALSAQSYHEKGALDFKNGNFESAIQNWTQAEILFKEASMVEKQCAARVDLARSYQALGMNSKAIDVLEPAFRLAEKFDNFYDQAVVTVHLGSLYTQMGEADQAQAYLDQSLLMGNKLDNPLLLASILNNQGNLFLFQKKYQDAFEAFMDSIRLSKAVNKPTLTVTALINAARIQMQLERLESAKPILDEAFSTLTAMEDSHFKAYALINIGLAYYELGFSSYQVFSEARYIAQNIDDYRALSYALGYMGKLYEDDERYEDALTLTHSAAAMAQKVYSPESLYRWQWQTGRILKETGHIAKAVAAYRRTLYTLQSIRQEINNCHDIQQASFREVAGSISSEMVDLLLRHSKTVQDPDIHESLLLEARDVVELLRVYELRNYFKDDCVDAGSYQGVTLDDISNTAAVIYPVMLADRTELLVSLPSGLKQFTLPIDKAAMTKEIRQFRNKLEKRTTWEFLPHARKLYDYLIRPVEADLSAAGVDTLVFVPSGPLRTVPMAALQDGRQFLVEKYATAITPGLNLIDPTPIRRENIKILAAGVTEASQGFPPLPEVAFELQNISKIFLSKLLLNQDFLVSNMETELKKEEFNIVHIASHGQFQGDVNETFVLAFDDKLTMDTLDKYAGFLQFRQTPLDLLALSACESAAGDDMAALGMAGVAVKAGARSALATLWFINDMASSLLIKEFYHQISNPSVSRAKALQQAQLSLAKDPRFDHPGYWSPFLLINNWL